MSLPVDFRGQDKLWGTLTLRLSHGEDLPNVEWKGHKQDPYCEMKIGKLAPQESLVHEDGGKAPRWNQVFDFEPVSAQDELRIKIRDKNKVLKDVTIGTCALPVAMVASRQGEVDIALPVVRARGGGCKGRLLVRASFKPLYPGGHAQPMPPSSHLSLPRPCGGGMGPHDPNGFAHAPMHPHHHPDLDAAYPQHPEVPARGPEVMVNLHQGSFARMNSAGSGFGPGFARSPSAPGPREPLPPPGEDPFHRVPSQRMYQSEDGQASFHSSMQGSLPRNPNPPGGALPPPGPSSGRLGGVGAGPGKPPGIPRGPPGVSHAPAGVANGRGPRSGFWVLPEKYRDRDASFAFQKFEVVRSLPYGTIQHGIKKFGQRDIAVVIKTIRKSQLVQDEEGQHRLAQEMAVLEALKEHPRVLQLVDAWESADELVIVTEKSPGDQVPDAMGEWDPPYSEADVMRVMRAVLEIVADLHDQGIVHGGLNPTCLWFGDKHSNRESPVKLSGFDSAYIQHGPGAEDAMASDVWTCGCLIHYMLTGRLPFKSGSFVEAEVPYQSLIQPLNLSAAPWPEITEGAKEVVVQALAADPAARPPARALLQHAWFDEATWSDPANQGAGTPLVLEGLKKFTRMSKFMKLTVSIIADCLPEGEVADLRELFHVMDVDGSGSISLDEFSDALKNDGQVASRAELAAMMRAADVDGDAELGFEEFKTVMVAVALCNHTVDDESLKRAFAYFDKDSSGEITRAELYQVLYQEGLSHDDIPRAMREFDADGDGKISYSEFRKMIKAV